MKPAMTFGAEACETLAENHNAEGHARGNENVDAQVELATIDLERKT
jgi:hypothetical protein